MYQIITLFVLAALAVAASDARAYAGQNQKLNVQSSSAFSGPNSGGGPGSGSAATGGGSLGASASASSYAGSSSYSGGGGNSGGSYSGGSSSGSPGSYGQGDAGSYGQGGPNAGSPSGSYGQGPSKGYGDKGPDNAIPSGNTPGSANFASSYPGSGSGYAGGFSNSYGSGGGFQDSGFTPGQNLPPGCFSGFAGAGFDPFRIHQEIMNQIQRQHEENLRFGANLAAQAGQGGPGGAHTVTYVYHTGNAYPWTAIKQAAAFNQQLANFFRTFPWPVPAVVPFSFPRVVQANTWYSQPKNNQRYTGYQSAFASGHIGPQGGYGAAGVAPKDPGSVATRFGEPEPAGPVHSVSGNIAPPSGGSYGISTSSHSVTDVVNGVPKTYKESSVTVNDNGKVTSYKSHSP